MIYKHIAGITTFLRKSFDIKNLNTDYKIIAPGRPWNVETKTNIRKTKYMYTQNKQSSFKKCKDGVTKSVSSIFFSSNKLTLHIKQYMFQI